MQAATAVGSMAHNTAFLIRSGQNVSKATKGDISEYNGPDARDFPFRAIRMLGAAQLIVALLIQILTIIQISLGHGDRFVFLANASVNVWTPLPAIAAGIVALSVSHNRYWETQCMKVAYFILSILSAVVFMVILLFVTGIVESNYYGVSTRPIIQDKLVIPTQVYEDLQDTETVERTGVHKALIGGVISLALLELIISFIAVFVLCYCSPTYKLKDKAMKKKLHGAHNPKIQRGGISSSDEEDGQKVLSVMRDNRGQTVTCNVYPCPPQHPSTLNEGRISNTYVTNGPSSIFIVD